MAYHEVTYLFLFLPLVLLAYQLTPQKKRWCILLLAGYAFFWMFSKKLVLVLMATSLFTHYIGLWLERIKSDEKQVLEKNSSQKEVLSDAQWRAWKKQTKLKYKKKQKRVLLLGIGVLLGILGYLKYAGFFVENVNGMLAFFGKSNMALTAKKLAVPIGISFYTLQAIGYLADVYWDKIKAERHLGKVALFLGFFPQIMEGPIAMYSQTADALWSGNPLRSENLAKGSIRILWGLFKKMIIADRLYYLVTEVFDHYANYSGAIVIVAAVSYAVQLYMEFSGCMDIVIGSGQMFGVTLPENFNQPFASKSAAEFWRRWHMTLGVWFKTYVFYPVSVSPFMRKWNKFGKAHVGKYMTKLVGSAIALFPVWLFNGLWHGPQWNYIFYGMYYFVILLLEVALEPLKEHFYAKTGVSEETHWWNVLRIAKTWLIIFTGELFFRANTLTAGFAMFASIFKEFAPQRLWDGTLLRMGLDVADYVVIVVGCIVVGVIGHLREKQKISLEQIAAMRVPLRWGLYYALIFAVILFGAYGVGYQQVDLIYAGF